MKQGMTTPERSLPVPSTRRSALKYHWVFLVAISAVLTAFFFYSWHARLVGDEVFHLPQIDRMKDGDFRILPDLTVIPTYHLILAGCKKLTGGRTVEASRCASFIGCLICVAVFYFLARKLKPDSFKTCTAQFAFLPLLFPFLFFLYTDIWALGLILLGFRLALAGRTIASALCVGGAVLIRQPSIFWGLFCWIIAMQNVLTAPVQGRARSKMLAIKTVPFALLFIAFASFVYWNKGVAVGDRASHISTFNLSNIWFFGLLSAFLFFPHLKEATRRVIDGLKRDPFLWLPVTALLFACYYASYSVHHGYNQTNLWEFLRNRLLFWTTTDFKGLAFIPVAYGLLILCTAPLIAERFRVFAPVALLSVVTMPLVEQRYYLVPSVLFLLFRKPLAGKWEIAMLLAYCACSIWFLVGILKDWFFL